jgi:hypothetical protein
LAKGTTPIGLAGLYLLGGIAGAALGTTALAGWLDTTGSNANNDTLRDLAPKVQDFGSRTGLDRPYQWLHQLVRDAEAVKFSGAG